MGDFSPRRWQFPAAEQTMRAIEPVAGSRLSKPLTLAAMSLGFGVVQLDVTIVNTALSSIGASLGGGLSELQWVVCAYTIAFAALILTAGAWAIAWAAKKSSSPGSRFSRSLRSLVRLPRPRRF